MLATYIGTSIRLWIASSDPDSNVHTSSGATPDIGEFFMNTSTGALFLCYQYNPAQLWQSTTNSAIIQALIAAIPQADWAQINPASQNYIQNKPTIPAAQIQSDWVQSNNTQPDYIKNKPTLSTVALTGAYSDLAGKPTLSTVATTGAYADLTGKPSLATVATTGSYTDLSNKPTIPAAQIQSDWTQVSTGSLDYIKNKPALAAVATSGAYSDLSGRPTLATVATTGAYADLSGKPTIPAAQIQSDWAQTNSASLDYIKNKPSSSQSAQTRSFNTVFQVSSTRESFCSYSVEIGTTLTLVGGTAGSVILETASDSGFTTNVVEQGRISNANTGAIVVGVSLSQVMAAQLSVRIPIGYYCRIRTVTTTGTPTFTYRSGVETLL